MVLMVLDASDELPMYPLVVWLMNLGEDPSMQVGGLSEAGTVDCISQLGESMRFVELVAFAVSAEHVSRSGPEEEGFEVENAKDTEAGAARETWCCGILVE